MTPSPRERLITSTIALVREHGVAGTGITELLDHSTVARRTVYLHFPGGKEELVQESTRVAGRVMGAAISRFTTSEDPEASLSGFIEWWKDALVAGEFRGGCPVVAAALAGSAAPAATVAAAEAFHDWEKLISDQLCRSGIDTGTARSLASCVVCAVEGAVILAVASRSTCPLDDVGRHLGELVRGHLPD